MQIADQRWRAAIEDSAFAPPDEEFAGRAAVGGRGGGSGGAPP
ncbi:MAG: hypothetical protein ACLP50_15400 [Solirubrobacteraceae bacterium]|jgi:hypothetical protein